MKTQMDLLRVLETKQFTRVGGNETIKVDFRIICATNKDLEKAVKDGTFREDLYYRLNVFTIVLPPLRERKSDIPLLADYFVKKYAAAMGKQIDSISPEAMDVLVRYDWPGNVRELENAIERAMVVGQRPGDPSGRPPVPPLGADRHAAQRIAGGDREESHRERARAEQLEHLALGRDARDRPRDPVQQDPQVRAEETLSAAGN